MKFEWDNKKNQINYEKHGLSFSDAEFVFSGEIINFIDDRYAYGEERWITLGELMGRVVVVVHMPRRDAIRIISMRKPMHAKRKSIMSDLKRIDKMTDAEIDYSDIPPLDDTFFERATVKLPQKKDLVTLRVDHEVLEFYKHQGRGYQTLINAVLKMYAQTRMKQNFLKRRR